MRLFLLDIEHKWVYYSVNHFPRCLQLVLAVRQPLGSSALCEPVCDAPDNRKLVKKQKNPKVLAHVHDHSIKEAFCPGCVFCEQLLSSCKAAITSAVKYLLHLFS